MKCDLREGFRTCNYRFRMRYIQCQIDFAPFPYLADQRNKIIFLKN
jgi:hypothetical protein